MIKFYVVMIALIVVYGFFHAYYDGKHAADRYYAKQGCAVTLIAPVKYRVPAPQAKIEQPKGEQQ